MWRGFWRSGDRERTRARDATTWCTIVATNGEVHVRGRRFGDHSQVIPFRRTKCSDITSILVACSRSTVLVVICSSDTSSKMPKRKAIPHLMHTGDTDYCHSPSSSYHAARNNGITPKMTSLWIRVETGTISCDRRDRSRALVYCL